MKECRKLQLQAMLPAEHQRLVKYPLMLEQLAKQCDRKSTKSNKKSDETSLLPSVTSNEKGEGSDDESGAKAGKSSTVEVPKSPSTEEREKSAFVESTLIKKFVDRTRDIVDTIDKQVAEAQNIQRLAEIQRNLDTTGLEKYPESPICIEYKVSAART